MLYRFKKRTSQSQAELPVLERGRGGAILLSVQANPFQTRPHDIVVCFADFWKVAGLHNFSAAIGRVQYVGHP